MDTAQASKPEAINKTRLRDLNQIRTKEQRARLIPLRQLQKMRRLTDSK
jgi:hypothetical protein